MALFPPVRTKSFQNIGHVDAVYSPTYELRWAFFSLSFVHAVNLRVIIVLEIDLSGILFQRGVMDYKFTAALLALALAFSGRREFVLSAASRGVPTLGQQVPLDTGSNLIFFIYLSNL
jgi:hypothetical protein